MLPTAVPWHQKVGLTLLPVQFYQLQVKVAIDDDSGSNLDHRLVDLAIDYSID